MTLKVLTSAVLLSLGASCTDLVSPELQGPPDISWANEVALQCKASIGDTDARACIDLSNCMYERARQTLLNGRDPQFEYGSLIRTYNEIVPRGDATLAPVPRSMSFLRARATAAGPDALRLFAVMEQTRNACLSQTGLTNRIGYN